jgi:hypothetical protein
MITGPVTTYLSTEFTGGTAQGVGDYPDGFSPADATGTLGDPVPGCAVADDSSQTLGDSNEGRLAAALRGLASGRGPAASSLGQGMTAPDGQAPGGRPDPPVPLARELHPAAVTVMRRVTSAAFVAGTLALAGCLVPVAPPGVPAVLTTPTGRTHAELVRVVSRALNGAPVTIADSALTSDDVLIVERVVRRDERGRAINGREVGRPETFRLVKLGPRCVLVQMRTGRRWTLKSATCSPR